MEGGRKQKHALFRKDGIRGLASPSQNDGSFCKCNLKINVNEAAKEANIMLIFPLHDHDEDEHLSHDKNQRITLIFDASNIIPGTIKAEQAPMPSHELPWSLLARHKGNALTMVNFEIQSRAIILYPFGFQRDDSTTHMERLGALATSKSIRIVFDLDGWLNQDKRLQYRSLIGETEKYSAYHRLKTSQFVEVNDWTKLPQKVNVPEAPPSYTENAHSSSYTSKRSRRCKSSSLSLSLSLFLLYTLY